VGIRAILVYCEKVTRMAYFNIVHDMTEPTFPFFISTFKATVLTLLLCSVWKLKVFSTFRWNEVMFVTSAWRVNPTYYGWLVCEMFND
jgi:hypothetical protein